MIKDGESLPPTQSTCGHEYSEGWFNRTVWICTQPAGHKGWHNGGRKTWDSNGMEKPSSHPAACTCCPVHGKRRRP